MLSIGSSKISKLYLGDTEIKKAYLGDTLVFDSTPAKPSRLPAGYTEVEYIQFDEKSGINTSNRVTPSTLRLEIDMESTSAYSAGVEFIVSNKASKVGLGSNYDNVMNIYRDSNDTILCVAGSNKQNGANYTKFTATIPTEKRILVIYDGSTKQLNIGDTAVTIKPTTYQLKDYPLNFGVYSGATSTLHSLKYKLYSARLYSTPTSLQRDFVPCIDPSGVIGLYDLVYGKFYANANTGTFTAGPAV